MKNLTELKGTKVMLVLASSLPMLMSANVQAQDHSSYDKNGWYVGANIGKSKASIDTERLQTSLETNGFDVSSMDEDSGNQGYKVYLGYQFGTYLAVEGGYFDLNDFSFLANTLPVTDFRGETGLKGWNLDLVGTLPLTERFSAIARIGLTQNDSKTRYSSNGLINTAAYNHDDSYTKHKLGVGLQYDISPAFTVRLEAERYRMDDLIGNKGDLDLYSLGLVYRFGSTTQSEPQAAPAPAQKAQAAVVAQTVVKEPEVLVLEDVHFNFDTAELNDETKVILRQHVQTLKANPQARVRIAGYTSASGSAEYNQALSERRAQSIKAFLIAEGVDANRFKTIGFGQRNPAEYEANPSVLRSDAAKANMRGLFEIIVE
ncbi:outer membrane protein/peptidoglycan-associated (lipo)protein [Rheinheimera sp. A13L]|uniref:OmpA family protein n=1 Tax=Rheinheimera sp. A13L TaxID=506534 RepID=UPI0002124A45|nr:OmpA family protein [Rheinheimera sp. A13L]EGM78317.1 outer membrane protein/peptidoglycan-associated (lipo)protein [Rheinheimera sp. A13L]